MEIKYKLSIDELEKLFNKEDTFDNDKEIEILPNGEIVIKGMSEKLDIKPLTFKEQLGGEYCELKSASL